MSKYKAKHNRSWTVTDKYKENWDKIFKNAKRNSKRKNSKTRSK